VCPILWTDAVSQHIITLTSPIAKNEHVLHCKYLPGFPRRPLWLDHEIVTVYEALGCRF
jgi:hypothetical protein